MAHFSAILTNEGAKAIAAAMYNNTCVFPDFAQVGDFLHPHDSDPLERALHTEVLSPLESNVELIDRELIISGVNIDGIDLDVLNIKLWVTNAGITKNTAIREIMLYANTSFGKDMTQAIPFAYAWLADEADSDNILPPPGIDSSGGQVLTTHEHNLVLFVTNAQSRFIEVTFSPEGFATKKYLKQALDAFLELSSRTIPLNGTRLHHFIQKEVS